MAARKNKIQIDQKTKDEIRGSQLVNLLTEYAKSGTFNGQPVDANRIAAARAALPFLRPTLASVEQTNLNPQDQVTEQQLMATLHAVIQANPDLLPQLIAMQQKPADAQPSHTPPVTH